MSKYLDLMEQVLTGTVIGDPQWDGSAFDLDKRISGGDWPSLALSMIGRKRMRQLRMACVHMINSGIPGDFVECGVWRGGASIMMQACLKEADDQGIQAHARDVIMCDSFCGLPETTTGPDEQFHLLKTARDFLAVSSAEVIENYRRFGLLAHNVRPVPGWFKESLPAAIKNGTFSRRIAILRVDADLYSSTMDVLTNLYSLVNVGGYVIIDDYGEIPQCRRAVSEFRAMNKIRTPMIEIDHSGIYWIKDDERLGNSF